jgi:uncharacterized protein YjeT (DUF2065 family)
MDLSRTAAAVLTLSGLALVVAGVCLVFVPAGLVIAVSPDWRSGLVRG